MRRVKFLSLLAGALGCLGADAALAKNAGLAVEGCGGCHNGGKEPTITLSADPASVEPGGSTLLTLRISRSSGNVGGFYLTANGKGAFAHMAGTRMGTAAHDAVHSAPRSAATGDVTWQLRWTAPATKGSVDFDVYGLSANGNGARSGDSEGQGRLSLVYGCGEGIMAFVDRDGDGYGITEEPTRVCEMGPGVASRGGDCNDNTKDIHPGRPEICNFYDDNCDGKVNEGLPIVTIYRDDDGDGHGARFTMDTRMHCGPQMGYAATSDDCDDKNKDVHVGAMEICNGRDDNCNGRIDDGAQMFCGVGWCRRAATSCDGLSCTPGQPMTEKCNGLDDDCDGMTDEGELCESGKSCVLAQCLTKQEAAEMIAARPELPPEAAGRPDGGASVDAPAGGNPAEPEGEQGGRAPAGGCAVGSTPAPAALPLFAAALALLFARRRR